MTHTGVVLYCDSQRNRKVVLLDDLHGRVEVIFFDRLLSRGTCVEYRLQQGYGGRQRMTDCSIIQSPDAIARADILFLHHVLELCLLCIPEGSCTAGVFLLLQYLYVEETFQWDYAYKLFFIMKLLMTVGVYASLPEKYTLEVAALLHDSPDSWKKSPEIVMKYQKLIGQWIWDSLVTYAVIERCKTIQFLIKDDRCYQ